MAALIERVRLMVGDPVVAGTPPTSVFTDQQIQDALDQHRTDVIQARLIPRAKLTANGAQWLDYQARWGFWEADLVLEDRAFATLTPTTSDLLTAHWTFTTSQLPPVYITGKSYDIYGAAVEILEAWQVMNGGGDFDFSEDGQSFSLSQRGTGLASLANEYRRKAIPAGPRIAGLESDPLDMRTRQW